MIIRALLLVVIAAVFVAVVMTVTRARTKRHHTLYLARYAPDLLDHEDLNPKIAQLIVGQRQEIAARTDASHEIEAIVAQLLAKPDSYGLGELYNPLVEWQKKQFQLQQKKEAK